MNSESPLAALIDAGPLIALFDATDDRHPAMTEFFRDYRGRLHTTWPVVCEVCHFLDRAQQRAFLAWLRRGGAQLAEIDDAGLAALDALVADSDHAPDLAVASLAWLGSKLKLGTIISLDANGTAAGAPFRNLLLPA